MEPLRSLVPALGGAGELTAQPARLLADGVRRGDLSAEEVVAAHLTRIAEIEPVVHSLVHVDAEGALAKARRLDDRRRRGERLGPLAGVPFVVKDNIDVRRQTTACGSRAHQGVVALRHAPVVARVLSAGGVLIGRANMDELAMGASTQTSAFGPTRNPWDVRRSPGGSSGGSAAAVAAGLVPLSLGTDTGGSIREPASQCGVVGMAPSAGLVSTAGVVPFAPELDRVGPIARDATDAALLLAAMSGRQASGVAVPAGLRVGVIDELAGAGNRAGVRERFDEVAETLRRLGHQPVPVSIPDAGRALGAYMTITSAACVPLLERYVRSGQAGAEVARRWELGAELLRCGAAELAAANALQHRLAEQVRAALRTCDVLLSPTMPTTAPLLDGLVDPILADAGLDDPMTAPYTDCWTVAANLARVPALSVPAGLSAQDGMPVGAMLWGRPGADALLLALAAHLA